MQDGQVYAQNQVATGPQGLDPLDSASVGGCVPGPARLNSLMSFAGFEPGLAPLALRDPRWAQL